MNNGSPVLAVSLFTLLGAILIIGLTTLGMWGCPKYQVYQESKAGEAILAHAQFSREVAVAEAKAKMEAAELLAQAEVKRAEGVAKANTIIGQSLKNNESYLRYLWINNLENTRNNQVIYIPTEAGLPILEAGRFRQMEQAVEPKTAEQNK
jgi:regulator of protease activity HflC (stomatin/prohibitin superfamily)